MRKKEIEVAPKIKAELDMRAFRFVINEREGSAAIDIGGFSGEGHWDDANARPATKTQIKISGKLFEKWDRAADRVAATDNLIEKLLGCLKEEKKSKALCWDLPKRYVSNEGETDIKSPSPEEFSRLFSGSKPDESPEVKKRKSDSDLGAL